MWFSRLKLSRVSIIINKMRLNVFSHEIIVTHFDSVQMGAGCSSPPRAANVCGSKSSVSPKCPLGGGRGGQIKPPLWHRGDLRGGSLGSLCAPSTPLATFFFFLSVHVDATDGGRGSRTRGAVPCEMSGPENGTLPSPRPH